MNLTNIVNQDGGLAMVEEYLNKRLLERRDWESVLINKKWGRVDPLKTYEGQWSKFTRLGRARRPETMASPSGAGSDPASGAILATEQVKVPIEFLHEYIDVSKVAKMTSWVQIVQWAREELPYALKRRLHELCQNSFVVGRQTPGVWSSTGTIATTGFDQTAEPTVTLYGESFTFLSAPKYYCGNAADFSSMDMSSRANWADVRRIVVRLGNAGARKINGTYICVCSEASWNDLLMDDDNGRLTAAIAGGLQTAIKGLENQSVFRYAGVTFIIDDAPYTEDPGGEGKRANFGQIHSMLFFGEKSYTWMPMSGSKGGAMENPPLKVTDTTKTGYSFSIGYMIPYQTAVVNDTWACVYKAPVSEYQPNGFDESDPTAMLERFQNYA